MKKVDLKESIVSKREYSTPTIIKLGEVRDVTMGSQGRLRDNGAQAPSRNPNGSGAFN